MTAKEKSVITQNITVFFICLVGSFILFHFTFSWFDGVQFASSAFWFVLNHAVDNPKAAGTFGLFFMIVFGMAISDRFPIP